MRLSKYEEKAGENGGRKNGECNKWILYISYELPVMFSTFSLLVPIKCFLKKMSVNATDMTYSKSAPEQKASKMKF